MLDLKNLDKETRAYMMDELQRDITASKVFISPRLTPDAIEQYQIILKAAIESGSDLTLSQAIRDERLLVATEQRRNPKGGGYLTAKVPVNAADVLAEGEFNRYYIRGVCRRALKMGDSVVIVYRAKHAANPRPGSQDIIGSRLDAAMLLDDLRAHMGDDNPTMGIPAGPNSGLSVHLP